MSLDISGEPHAGRKPDACTHFLHRTHQGVSEKRKPNQTKTFLSSHLGISGNARRVIIGGARSQTWSQNFPILPNPFFHCLIMTYFAKVVGVLSLRSSAKAVHNCSTQSLLGKRFANNYIYRVRIKKP